MAAIVLVELNEVPNAVLDAYAERSAFMKEFLAKSRRFDTVAADQLQLDPWIAWPTFHRGVPDTTHRLLRLGQDSASVDGAFPPVWRKLVNSGRSVGVYGSLFSNTETDLGPYDFFVPDVFSPHSNVKPSSLEKFQRFNLAMTRASGRNPSREVSGGAAGAVVDMASKGQLRLSTMLRVASQLLSEKIKPARLSRRRNIQTELHGDVFLKLWKEHRPEFSTFYTNNVAAAMHRFWSAAFTGDSINGKRLDPSWIRTYGGEVFAALYSVERLLQGLLELRDPPIIVLASAIGQEEIPAVNHSAFVSVVDIDKLLSELLPEIKRSEYELLPTMVPDFSIRFSSPKSAALLCDRLAGLSIGGHEAVKTLERMKEKQVVFDERVGHPSVRHDYHASEHFKHAVTYESSDPVTVHLSVQIDDFSGDRKVAMDGRIIPFAGAGVGDIVHAEGVNCTAQHCAVGSMAIYQGTPTTGPASVVSVLDFVPSILKHFGLAVDGQLPGKITIKFA